MTTINCRGQACPGPVIAAKKALERTLPGSAFILEVDGDAGRENVRRFAISRGASVSVSQAEDGAHRLFITAGQPSPSEKPSGQIVVFITGDLLGSGDEKLGRILMEGFVRTLVEQTAAPDKILFMNGGVRLAAEGSPVLHALRSLADRGCEVSSCGTCLDFFGLKDKLAAGSVSSMFDIQGALLRAERVIRV